MVLIRPVVDSPEAVEDAARDGVDGIEVVAPGALPSWLGDAVARAHSHHLTVAIHLQADPSWSPEQATGWEIGALVGALRAGVDDVIGADPVRVARVRTVLDAVATGKAPR